MIEHLFRPSREGRRARIWHGRYNLGRGQPVRSVSLDTPDKTVARARLRALVVEKQSEEAGIIAPGSQRAAAAAPLKTLVAEYLADVRARLCTAKHESTTRHRLFGILAGTGWKRLADIRPEQFLAFRRGLRRAPKTVNEYQFALNSFLNWLEGLGRIAANPLKKVVPVKTRGMPNQAARALTLDEVRELMGVAKTYRAQAYHFLALTGMRYNEARTLLWADIHGLEGARPYARLAAENTKGRTKRVIPLHRELAAMLRTKTSRMGRVFRKFPKLDTLWRDMAAAGIGRSDERGRRVHFHSFRKTFQTLGVMAGVSQRAAQELLGHSDANLTAKIYTDLPTSFLHEEVEKLPLVHALTDSQPTDLHEKCARITAPLLPPSPNADFDEIRNLLQTMRLEFSRHIEKLVEVAGVEPACP